MVSTQSPRHDYAAMTCEQLLAESKHLLRRQSHRNEYLLEDAEELRRTAKANQKVVARLIAERNC